MSHHNQLLAVDLADDRVEISIGRKALLNFLKHSDQWPVHQSGRALKILDEEQFLEEFCNYLMQESENGETVLHNAFEAAMVELHEDGSETVEDESSLGAGDFTSDDDEYEEDEEDGNEYRHDEWN